MNLKRQGHRPMRIVAVPVALVVVALLCHCSPARATSYRHYGALHQLGNLDRALQSFFHDVGRFPSTDEGLKALVEPSSGLSTWSGPYLRKDEFVDPWGVDLEYVYPAVHGSLAFDLYSLGRNGMDDKGGGDDLSNWAYYDSKQYPVGDFWNDALMWVVVLDLPAFLTVCTVVFVFRRIASGRGSNTNRSLTEPLQPSRGPNRQPEAAGSGPSG